MTRDRYPCGNTLTVPKTIGFLATKRQILVFKLFQPWVSDMHNKAEASILLVVLDAFCKRSHNMLAVVGNHAICCLQHVQHCCIQCACMQIANLNTTCVLHSSSRSSVEQPLMCYGRRSASGTSQKTLLTLKFACNMKLARPYQELSTCWGLRLRQVLLITL